MISANSSSRLVGVALAVLLSGLCRNVEAQVPATYYKQNCFSCHTIGGGRLTGPDLRDVEQRQSREWLVAWMLDPPGVLASGDPYAAKMQKEARGAVMNLSPGMTRDLANSLLDLIKEESALEKSQFEGVKVSDRALLPEDIVEGRMLFSGEKALKNGGPACIGCHNVNSLGFLGGGRLGLNLTRAYARLDGRKGLSAWLVAPPSPTMNPIYSKQPIDEAEILPLVAYLKNETEEDRSEDASALINFLLVGVVGAAALLVIFDSLWRRRFRGVRGALVNETYQPASREN